MGSSLIREVDAKLLPHLYVTSSSLQTTIDTAWKAFISLYSDLEHPFPVKFNRWSLCICLIIANVQKNTWKQGGCYRLFGNYYTYEVRYVSAHNCVRLLIPFSAYEDCRIDKRCISLDEAKTLVYQQFQCYLKGSL